MITGVDLIQEQILAAQGEVLRFKQEDIQLKVNAAGLAAVSDVKSLPRKVATMRWAHPNVDVGL
jgi:biotin carboxylase